MSSSKSAHSIVENKSIIGVDFDNTIICYDEILSRLARERGISLSLPGSKKVWRDLIRRLPDGEMEWQRIQAAMYGPRIGEARLTDHVTEFFGSCRKKKVPVYIVSHKSRYAAQDRGGVDLREAALQWMHDNLFFSADGLGLAQDSIFFCDSRSEKVQKIKQLGCRYFIDDLEETFQDDDFPPAVQGILYAPVADHSPISGRLLIKRNWQEISQYFFPPC